MSGKLKIILLEASLETVPASIAAHPAVVKSAARRGKKPTDILLDVSIHYHAMKRLPLKHKRGRPDIVHVSLLEALESPLNKAGMMEIYVHTLNGHAILINPSTRIPRNYNRFTGLMEQLFKEGSIPPGSANPLLRVETMPLERLLEAAGARGLILLREACEPHRVEDVAREALEEGLAVGVGGFPHGDFEEETLRHASRCYSIHREPLATWIVVSRVIAGAERVLGVLS
ncbi:16S rRNA methyltransferase [Desulfurococcus mucosus]|uniref:Ribosomal RNA small subunit methyltransferase Nep1 n=1 Tax=Desulfurococcus mucosus (strain ATCC 35584 / DSM 2162 / JCM 9187 / O7/1) TaxID=765177 RepID=E8RAB9_DESM0|nr:Suppressor Mra1 family protein [Desulfurococcus mucosus DSM 2162]